MIYQIQISEVYPSMLFQKASKQTKFLVDDKVDTEGGDADDDNVAYDGHKDGDEKVSVLSAQAHFQHGRLQRI